MTELVDHYQSGESLLERIAAAAAERGGTRLTPADVAGADEFHAGQGALTALILDDLEALGVGRGIDAVDLGSGLGGAARRVADRFDAAVLGVDLAPDFVDAANALSALLGSNGTRFVVGDAIHLPLDPEAVDLATMFHVGMNVADKAALCREVARVLRPGGLFAVFDIMRIGPGEITFPVPWSHDAAHSHVEEPAVYQDAMGAAGLAVERVVDRREDVRAANEASAADPPLVTLADVFGAPFTARMANARAATAAGALAAVEIIARR